MSNCKILMKNFSWIKIKNLAIIFHNHFQSNSNEFARKWFESTVANRNRFPKHFHSFSLTFINFQLCTFKASLKRRKCTTYNNFQTLLKWFTYFRPAYALVLYLPALLAVYFLIKKFRNVQLTNLINILKKF